jgi:hypothetical protein
MIAAKIATSFVMPGRAGWIGRSSHFCFSVIGVFFFEVKKLKVSQDYTAKSIF